MSSTSETNFDKQNSKEIKPSFKRAYSLLGPLPRNTFGPKATINSPAFSEAFLIDEPDKKLTWSRTPENVLIVKKIDEETVEPFKKCARWLATNQKLAVFAEIKVFDEVGIKDDRSFKPIFQNMRVFSHTTPIDLIISLGGDGTLLYTASLFQHSMPPIVPFHMGSLGFMTSHRIEEFEKTLTGVLEGKSSLMLRSRLRCTVTKKESAETCIQGNSCLITSSKRNGACCNESSGNGPSFLVLNEVSI